MNLIYFILRIYTFPYRTILSMFVVVYFYKVFKNDIEYRQTNDNIFKYFSDYFPNIIIYTNNLSDKPLFVIIRNIFSLLFWATITYLIIY